MGCCPISQTRDWSDIYFNSVTSEEARDYYASMSDEQIKLRAEHDARHDLWKSIPMHTVLGVLGVSIVFTLPALITAMVLKASYYRHQDERVFHYEQMRYFAREEIAGRIVVSDYPSKEYRRLL